MNRKIQSNIWKLYLISGLLGLTLYYTIDKVFMEARGLSISEIVLIEIVYAVFVLLLEVPSGALSDRWSRKKVLALNVLFFMASTVIWALSHDFIWFAIGVVAAAIHSVLSSGTYNSMLYDSLKEIKKEKDADQVIGKAYYYDGLFAVAGGVLGGVVASWLGLEMTFWLTLIPSAIALLLCFSLREPTFHRTTGEVGYWKHMVDAFSYLRKHPTLYHIIAFLAVLTVSYRLIDEYVQLYYVRVGVPIFWLGFLGALTYLFEAYGGKISQRVRKIGSRVVYLCVILLAIIGFLLVGVTHTLVGVAFSYLPLIAVFLARPLLYVDLHDSLPSSHRATGESYASMLISLLFIPIGLAFSHIADAQSIFTAYSAIGMMLGVYAVFFLLLSFKKNHNRRQ